MLPLCLFWVVLAMGLGTATIVFVPKTIRSGCRILVLEGCLKIPQWARRLFITAISFKYWKNRISSSQSSAVVVGMGVGGWRRMEKGGKRCLRQPVGLSDKNPCLTLSKHRYLGAFVCMSGESYLRIVLKHVISTLENFIIWNKCSSEFLAENQHQDHS